MRDEGRQTAVNFNEEGKGEEQQGKTDCCKHCHKSPENSPVDVVKISHWIAE